MTNPENPTRDVERDWRAMLDALRQRFPGANDSTLFCIFKLQQDPELRLRDFRGEAMLHGLRIAGRSLHAARVLLGLAQEPAPKRTSPPRSEIDAARATRRRERRARAARKDRSIEDDLIEAVRRIHESSAARANRLRKAVQEAIALLQDALEQE